MATKKRGVKMMSATRKSAWGKGEAARVAAENAHDDAVRILRAEYYGSIRSYAQEFKAAVATGEIADRDGFEQRLHETIEGSEWVIYTNRNIQVLFCSDSWLAYFDQGFGEVPATEDEVKWAVLAFWAMDQDLRQQLEAEGVEAPED